MRTIEVQLFQFDELDDTAKERAREWYRNVSQHDEWWECVYDDAERIGLKITGFDVGRSQSIDYELTEGVNEVCRRIIDQHGKDCRTYATAMAWIADKGKRRCTEREGEEAIADFAYSLAQDYWFMLRDEYEYRYSDECVDENIRANEYEFMESGRMA